MASLGSLFFMNKSSNILPISPCFTLLADSAGKRELIDKLFHGLLLVSALIGVASLLFIGVFIVKEAFPAFEFSGFFGLVLGNEWLPPALYGILPMILASLWSTLIAVAIGVPIGVLAAIFLAEIAPDWLTRLMRPAIELLAGIPSVVYGFFGLVVIVPLLEEWFSLPSGATILAASIVLAIMILPTVITVSETSLRALPTHLKEGALALGASKIYTIFYVLVPAARSGISTGVILGIARAVGETMAVIMVMGNAPAMPEGVMEAARSMTANIALEMSYATGIHASSLYATGVILLVFIMILNSALMYFNRQEANK